jgi:hypothetical protein
MRDRLIVLADRSGTILAAHIAATRHGDAPTVRLIGTAETTVREFAVTDELKRAGLEGILQHYRLRVADDDDAQLVRVDDTSS